MHEVKEIDAQLAQALSLLSNAADVAKTNLRA
jgi:hypothetical protein